MFVAEDMYKLGSQRSAIRELFEYGKQRAAVVGAENVYDFSLGNPTVPAPDCVNETIRDLTQKLDSISLHGYTSAQGDIETRQAIADYLNKTYETAFSADNFYLTMGAAASLSVCFRALTTSPEDEFITIAPFFPEYRVFVEANGAKLVVVPPHTSDFQIDFDALEKAISVHTKGVIINSPNNPSGAVYSKETIQKLAALLTKKSEENGTPIFILADEPYREIAYDGVEVPYVTKYYANTLVCYSYSKSLSLPGERIGYVIVPDEVTESKTVYAAIAGAGAAGAGAGAGCGVASCIGSFPPVMVSVILLHISLAKDTGYSCMISLSTRSPISILKEIFTNGCVRKSSIAPSSIFPVRSIRSATGGLISIFLFSMDDNDVAAEPII